MHGRAWSREEAIEALETPERLAGRSAERLWDRLALSEGATVADIGAGTGYFALPAARRVGAHGRVYAIDLSAELVALMGERAQKEGLRQFVSVQNTTESIPLPSAIADLVLLANVLHDFPPATIRESVRLLKPNGRLINLDWKKEETPGGPPVGIRFSPDEAAQVLGSHGLLEVERWEMGRWHYALALVRSERSGASQSSSAP